MDKNFITRGFQGKKRTDSQADRLPPGQYLVHDFPVLSAGPTPSIPLDQWNFTVRGLVGESNLELAGISKSALRNFSKGYPLCHQMD